MTRRFKRRILDEMGVDLGQFYHRLPDDTITKDPARALKAHTDGLDVHRVRRLDRARLGPLITEDWPANWPPFPHEE